MNKEEALEDFFRALKVTLTNAFLYSKDHPYFVRSAEQLKNKLEILFGFLEPVAIGVTPATLLIDGKTWDKKGLFDELARVFHQRKIKSIRIEKGFNVGELVTFLSAISMPPKDIIKNGGINRVFNKDKVAHFAVEELDYSLLLSDQGEECKDVWQFLLKEATERKDDSKVNELANNFGTIVGSLKEKELLEDGELQNDINKFLKYLKASHREKYYKCTKEIFRTFSKHGRALEKENIDKIKKLFSDFEENDFAELFLDEILNNDAFDILGFKLFSQLSDETKNKEINEVLLNRISEIDSIKKNPKAMKKIQDLLTVSDNDVLSGVYKNTLLSLSKNISFDNRLSFDLSELENNYRFILVDLFGAEKNKARLGLIVKRLLPQVEKAIQDKDIEYIESITDVLNKRSEEGPSLGNLFDDIKKRIYEFVESVIWEEDIPDDFKNLIENLEMSSQGADFYLNNIFDHSKITPQGLHLFFRFFPEDLSIFYKRLQKKNSDLEFLQKLLENLRLVNPTQAQKVLKYIFSCSGQLIKLRALEMMRDLPETDEKFLLSVLQNEDFSLKKEAILILAKNEQNKKAATEKLCLIPGLFGIKNKAILNNLELIEAAELRGATVYLRGLAKKHLFWNRGIRKRAQEILRKWNDRED